MSVHISVECLVSECAECGVHNGPLVLPVLRSVFYCAVGAEVSVMLWSMNFMIMQLCVKSYSETSWVLLAGMYCTKRPCGVLHCGFGECFATCLK